MVKGVKKINCVGGLVYNQKSKPGSLWVIKPDQYVYFAVSEWHPATTAADKAKDITWIRQSADRKTTFKQMLVPAGKKYALLIPKKLCGNFSYYIEASLSGNKDKANTGLFVRGFCPPLIVSSKWSTQSGGSNIKNQAGIIKYGHVVHLNLQTEGLNQNNLTIEVYNRIGLNRDDKVVGVYTNVACVNGEVDLQIRNTFAWMAKINNISSDEDFYIKVKDAASNQYIKDGLGQDLHAVYLKIRNEVATTVVDGARNNKVAKVGQAEINSIQYSPCKFNKIEVTELVTNDGIVKPQTTLMFNEGTTVSGTQIISTVAPDKPTSKELFVVVGGFSTEKCKDKKHTSKKIIFREVGQTIDKEDKQISTVGQSNVKQKIYSPLTRNDAITHIWPKSVAPNQFWYYINSCRYYSEPVRPTIIVKTYSDIKWTLKFYLNLTNDLSIAGSNLTAAQLANLRKKAGKIGAENRWKQKDASLGFSLKGEWNKPAEKYLDNFEFKAEYEAKIKKIYDLFASIGNIADGITNKSKGQIRNIGFKGIPVMFAVKPPNVSLEATWMLERVKQKEKELTELGTKVSIEFSAEPLIGLEMTVDLLCLVVGGVAGALSGGTASQPAMRLYGIIKGKLNSGIKEGNDNIGFKANADVYIDLIISSTIKSKLGFSFNTAAGWDGSDFKLESSFKLKAEIKAGVFVKGEVALIIIKVSGYFEMSASGAASVTFGHGVTTKDNGLYYAPQLGFDGLDVEYLIKGRAGMSTKKVVEVSREDERTFASGEFKGLVPKFDVIKSLEEISGIEINIPLIKR